MTHEACHAPDPARPGPHLPTGLLPQPCWISVLLLTPFLLHVVKTEISFTYHKKYTPFSVYSSLVFSMITRSNPKTFHHPQKEISCPLVVTLPALPPPWKPLICFLSPRAYLFWKLRTHALIRYEPLVSWHNVSKVRPGNMVIHISKGTPSFLWLNNSPPYGETHLVCPSSDDGHLGGFQ